MDHTQTTLLMLLLVSEIPGEDDHHRYRVSHLSTGETLGWGATPSSALRDAALVLELKLKASR